MKNFQTIKHTVFHWLSIETQDDWRHTNPLYKTQDDHQPNYATVAAAINKQSVNLTDWDCQCVKCSGDTLKFKS